MRRPRAGELTLGTDNWYGQHNAQDNLRGCIYQLRRASQHHFNHVRWDSGGNVVLRVYV